MSERVVLIELVEGPYDGIETVVPLESICVCKRCGAVHDMRIRMPPQIVRLGPNSLPQASLPREAPVPGDRVADYGFQEEGYRIVRFGFRGYSVVQLAEYQERER